MQRDGRHPAFHVVLVCVQKMQSSEHKLLALWTTSNQTRCGLFDCVVPRWSATGCVCQRATSMAVVAARTATSRTGLVRRQHRTHLVGDAMHGGLRWFWARRVTEPSQKASY